MLGKFMHINIGGKFANKMYNDQRIRTVKPALLTNNRTPIPGWHISDMIYFDLKWEAFDLLTVFICICI